MKLLHQLCEIQAPSGNERPLRDFLIEYINSNKDSWATVPELIYGDDFQDCLILKFGKPRTAIFAHMDSVGFTVRYENQLVPIGSPDAESGYKLVGQDSLGLIDCKLGIDKEHHIFYDFGRAIDRGTELTFKCDFRESADYVQSCYLDDRLGIYNALQVAETLTDGAIVFSCWEEHGGGSVPYLAKYIFEEWGVRQALISDITWVTDGVNHGDGVAISLRDKNIPRRHFINKILTVAQESAIPCQLEVEGGGSSDGRELQESPYPFDWCFIGAPESGVHGPNEKVHKDDIVAMIALYEVLMNKL